MRVSRSDEKGVWFVWGASEAEKNAIGQVLAHMHQGERLKYMGRRKLGDASILSLAYGCIEKGTCSSETCAPDCSKKKKFTIVGTTTKDKHEVNGLRDACYYGGGLLYVGETTVKGGKTALMLSGKQCSLCGAYISSWLSCHFGVCDKCAATCEHEAVEGIVIGGEAPYQGTYCRKCGRALSAFIDTGKRMPVEEAHMAC